VDPLARGRPKRDRRWRAVDVVCVLVVIVAVLALAVWIVTHHGGGVLNDAGRAGVAGCRVGDPGLEPGTSSLSEMRSNQLS